MTNKEIKDHSDSLDDFDLFLLMREMIEERKLEYAEAEDTYQNPTHTAKLAVIRTIFNG
tara:strand:+ start:44 stop:220 length:177 start_codon:yes stop_codon:yes gene_type:complete